MPIKGAPPNKGAPYGLEDHYSVHSDQNRPKATSIIDRFSIQNHRWKAQNLNFCSMVSYSTLLSRPAPLLGILRYSRFSRYPSEIFKVGQGVMTIDGIPELLQRDPRL